MQISSFYANEHCGVLPSGVFKSTNNGQISCNLIYVNEPCQVLPIGVNIMIRLYANQLNNYIFSQQVTATGGVSFA